MEEEATEDISKMAAVTPSHDSYLEQSVWQIWKNRIPWLLILMISATFTGLIINAYEATLSALLFACVPMIMGTGGNAGSQAAVTITRSLAIGEVRASDVLKVLWKELRVSRYLCGIGACDSLLRQIILTGRTAVRQSLHMGRVLDRLARVVGNNRSRQAYRLYDADTR